MLHELKKKHFIAALIITGFAGMMGQIVLLREMVIIFLGNELTLGMMLGIWLFGTALGSGLFVRWIQNITRTVMLFAWLQIALAVILPLTIICIRSSPALWGMNQGEIFSLLPIVLIPLTTLLPLCLLIGFLYTLGSRIYHEMTQEEAAAASKVYIYESIGSGVASLLVSIILIRFVDNFQLAVMIGIVSLISGGYLLHRTVTHNKFVANFAIFSLLLIMIFTFPFLNRFSHQKFWRHLKVVHEETTIYGNIAVTKFDDTINFHENGFLMFSCPDILHAEEAVHFALLEHPEPKDVLLIGGGVGGSLAEILRHPDIRRLDYVELDPKIIQLSRIYLPPELVSAQDDPRVFIHNLDGRRFLKMTSQTYDVIIVNLPDPETMMINRFYTREFFNQAREILTDKGMISFSVTSSVNVIGEELADLLSCLYHTLSSVFRDVIIIPGDTNHFIACMQKQVLTTNPAALIDRLSTRHLNLTYVNEYYIPDRMSEGRVDYVRTRIVDRPAREINLDFRPIGNFYHLVLWTTYFNQQLKKIFLFFDRIGFTGVFCFALLLLLTFVIKLFGRGGSFTYGILVSIMAFGFTGIALEVVIILGFQAIYGYVYFQLAIILSSFMIGLAGGSYIAIRMLRRMDDVFSVFREIQLLMAFYPLFLILFLSQVSVLASHGFFIQVLFSLLTISVGFIVGYQYPLACHLYGIRILRVEKVAGRIYAADLIGACFGALVTSALLIPVLGLTATCSAICVINLAVLAGLMLTKKSV